MQIEVIVSLISALGSALGTFAGIMVNSRLTNFRIEQLEKKVDMHNQVIDRVYELEKRDAVYEEELKVANHRISDLEVYHK
ncbi:MAG: hypothetical protein IJ304_01665 [Clostridia bacterium]|nr:hypothetical protein [Clostridia bacterium]